MNTTNQVTENMKKYKCDHRAFGTIAIHGGQGPDKHTGAMTVPISMATTFAQESPGIKMGTEQAESFGNGWEYSRTGNPTRGTLERALASMENGKHAVAFSSGMAATTAIIHLLKSGDHVLSMDDVYGGTQRYFRKTVSPTYDIHFDFVDFRDLIATEKAITKKTKLMWLETPTNPTLKISDISKCAEIAKKYNVILVVDNTFMSPYFQNPLQLGADIVLHSITKYINGHSDVIMGAVILNDDEMYEKLRFVQNGVGAVPSPIDCYLALRGLRTLHVRMAQCEKNAMAIAQYLEQHEKVEKVLYPGLESHPEHKIAAKQCHGYSGMVTFYLKGGLDEAKRVLENFKVFTLAESLGAVESLVESPAIMTHASVPEEHRNLLGITNNLIRLSVGIESLPDLITDLDNALMA